MDTTDALGRAYKEVWVFLHALPKRYMDALPVKLVEVIENHMDLQYEFELQQTSKGTNLSHDALNLIAALNLEFWAEEDERKTLYKKYSENQKKADLKSYEVFAAKIQDYLEHAAIPSLTPESYARMQKGCSEAFSILKTISKSILSCIPKSHILLIKINRDPKVQLQVKELCSQAFPEVSNDCMKILADIYCTYLCRKQFTVEDIEVNEEIPSYFKEFWETDDTQKQKPQESKLDYYKKISQNNE